MVKKFHSTVNPSNASGSRATPNQSPSTSSGFGARLTPFPAIEEAVLQLWAKEKIFQKSLTQTKDGERFVFFEGPPTANGKPGIHHVLARVYKDVIVRYKTMRGFFVERKAGWDTHGLPVELQVEKALGISGKQQIENIVAGDKRASIEKFNEACRTSVMEHRQEFEDMTKRIGFWLDMAHPYITYESNYVESVWWVFKQIWDAGLVYQGHKVVLHCPRCETTLSSHEVAQGYKSVVENSLYVKFRVTSSAIPTLQNLLSKKEDVFVLSWTTTPWTLPGNVALAIGKDIAYQLVKHDGAYLIIAKERVFVLGDDVKVLEDLKGEQLIGTAYEPLFPGAVERGDAKTAWTILAADFVTTTDGTGVVHTAVMYGEDDYTLGKSAGLPAQHTVDLTGKFLPSVGKWAGKFVKSKTVETDIITDLQERGLLHKVEPYTHDYPFCWRCSTPLLYYAKDSWFIKVSTLREKLIANNADINWIPSYLKDGRFGEWLKEAKDWAISRERYWGTPLPIWECEHCKTQRAVGSFADLYLPSERVEVLMLRHGFSKKNKPSIIQGNVEESHLHGLTAEGAAQVKKTAQELKGKVDVIIASDFERTRETAKIVSDVTGAPITFDPDLREIQTPDWEGQLVLEVRKDLPDPLPLSHHLGGGENYYQVRVRMQRAAQKAIRQYPGKRILLVSHGDPLWILKWSYSDVPESRYQETPYPKKGEAESLKVPMQFDPHRPFIDDVTLKCEKCQGTMHRVPEVMDVWFDSGAMPFAQWHYPFENQERIDQSLSFPADFITEGIDQTRGWFYTLLAVSTLLGKGAPYKNVISLGHILDAKGQKMSKSKGNVVEPSAVIDQYGADALRLHFFTMSQAGDPKNFDVRGVDEVVKKTLLIFWNVVTFYQTHTTSTDRTATLGEPTHILDQWILARLAQTTQTITEKLDAYDPTSAGRSVQDFITDLSTWYLRRSRDRLRGGANASPQAAATLHHVIRTTATLLAPFTPFLSEQVYQTLRVIQDPLSVHLVPWPTAGKIDFNLLTAGQRVRDVVELGHAIRKEQELKVRQPLARMFINVDIRPDLQGVLREELNVEACETGKDVPSGDGWVRKEKGSLIIALQTTIDEDLKHKGLVRELARHINDMRKAAGLTIKDLVDVEWMTDDATLQHAFTEHAAELRDFTHARSIAAGVVDKVTHKKELIIAGSRITFGISVS
ncbi:MAG: class I tRNA ligase family protein [bacterium]|nr:class I tRNA ligase family protein [bacterium]